MARRKRPQLETQPGYVDPQRISRASFHTRRWGRVTVWIRGGDVYRVCWTDDRSQNFITAAFDPDGIAAFLDDPEVSDGLARR